MMHPIDVSNLTSVTENLLSIGHAVILKKDGLDIPYHHWNTSHEGQNARSSVWRPLSCIDSDMVFLAKG
eukprot:scaffold9523_cov103-Cylindrotheca_fusiformis.AAC.8